MAVDMRSDSTEEAAQMLEARLLDLVKQAVVEENAALEIRQDDRRDQLIGDRPAGIVALDSPIVSGHAARVSSSPRARASPLPARAPIESRDVAGHSRRDHRRRRRRGNWHSRNEWYRRSTLIMAAKRTADDLMLTGLDGVTKRRWR